MGILEALKTAWAYRNAIAGAVLIAVIGGMCLWVGSLKNDLSAETIAKNSAIEDRDKAVDVANANAAALEQAKAERDQTVAILDAARASESKRQSTVKTIISKVQNAKPATTPAGDRLIAAHDGLRELVGQASN
jgi:hypothetical protein